MNSSVSRRIAKACMPLNLGVVPRMLIALRCKNASSYDVLPKWIKEIVVFGEQNTSKPDYSVDLTEELRNAIPKK